MDAFTYYLILSITIIVTIFFAIGMGLAYNQGLAQGRLEASIQHTELLVKQLAASQVPATGKRWEFGYMSKPGPSPTIPSQAQGEEDLIKLYKKVKEQTEASQAQPEGGE